MSCAHSWADVLLRGEGAKLRWCPDCGAVSMGVTWTVPILAQETAKQLERLTRLEALLHGHEYSFEIGALIEALKKGMSHE